MRRQVLLVVVGSFVGLLVGGLVGLAAGTVAGLNATRPQLLMRWMTMPLFAAMVLATLLQGRLEQNLGFGAERPMAHQIGLALIVTVAVYVIEAIIPVRAEPADAVGAPSGDELSERSEPAFPDGPSGRVSNDTP